MAKRHKRARAPKRTLDSISTFIINLSTRGGGITHGKLQLILFYVQAVSLAQQGRPMFEEDFIADTQGPILRSIRARYAHHGTEPIPHTETADAVPKPKPKPNPQDARTHTRKLRSADRIHAARDRMRRKPLARSAHTGHERRRRTNNRQANNVDVLPPAQRRRRSRKANAAVFATPVR